MQTIRNVLFFYIDGFKNMSSLSRKLWLIIVVKLVVIFVIVKTLFFPNYLETTYKSEDEKINFVIKSLTVKVRPDAEDNLTKGE